MKSRKVSLAQNDTSAGQAMSEILWKLPVPASSLLYSPEFAALGKRQCGLSMHVEGDDGIPRQLAISFQGVEAYRCTYLSSISAEMTRTAYGRLVRLGPTPWLDEVKKRYLEYHAGRGEHPNELEHLMICFDDGPCYEIICVGATYP